MLDTLLAKDPEARPSASEAARTARRLATAHSALPALEPADDLPEPVEVERPATMLRGELLRPDEPAAATASTLSGERPDLGEAGQRTVVRALARPLVPSTPTAEAGESPPSQRGRLPEWLTKRTVALGAAGIVLLIGLGAGAVLLFPGGSEKAEPVASDSAVTANQQDQARPTGLSTARSAAYDPASKRIVMEIVYSAQKSDLSGELLEVLPALGTKTCPPVAWTGATATRHAASTTGMTVSCGWRLADVRVPRDGRTTVKASLPGTVADAAALHAWLDEAATATNTAVSDPQVRGTAYPAQRLKGISVTTPARTVSQSPLPITLLPVWPSGTDTLNPLYQSPSAGSPSQLLQDIAGGESNVRFSDSCGGAVAVSSDGLTMTALSITPECRLRASVGNFTDLESTPFSVTTRD
ncbi:serine/threonine kinase [Leifsonia xyli subsp. cynodontis DSM 46306]|uniref:Uncharacterized protein n=1 Tax=Leifsonia xyli subsp. cynodontis DSM 46306 TaxID=1389489 RepID=U3PBR3_LEIXC|nr:serine/threonine kinase [Leifsonia xyli]AGW42177.1 serine/threonine kinase [Leifsonia xyli subsp. cynodontis DSM 46306]